MWRVPWRYEGFYRGAGYVSSSSLTLHPSLFFCPPHFFLLPLYLYLCPLHHSNLSYPFTYPHHLTLPTINSLSGPYLCLCPPYLSLYASKLSSLSLSVISLPFCLFCPLSCSLGPSHSLFVLSLSLYVSLFLIFCASTSHSLVLSLSLSCSVTHLGAA